MAYGLEVLDGNAFFDIANKSILLIDKFEVQYGKNGSKSYNGQIISASYVPTDDYILGNDSLLPKIYIEGRVVRWEWVRCRNKPSGVSIIILVFE